jgi:hypothetical protein
VVPVAAVLRDDKNEPMVYVQVEPGKFAQRPVTIGTAAGRHGGGRQRAQRRRPWCSDGSLFVSSRAVSNKAETDDRPTRLLRAQTAVRDCGGGAGPHGVGRMVLQKLPIDAYPDLSPPHVELITQWPGHAPEEIERLVTIPLEIELNGIPRLDSLRSISLYGLSFIAMNFEYGPTRTSCASRPSSAWPTPSCPRG